MMYKAAKTVGDYCRNIFNPIRVESEGDRAFVYKGKLFSSAEYPLNFEDVVGRRLNYNFRLARKMLRFCDRMEGKGEKIPTKWYFGVEGSDESINSPNSVKTTDAVYNMLKGRTYKPASDPRKPIRTLVEKRGITKKRGNLSWAALGALGTAYLAWNAQRRTGVPLEHYMSDFKDAVAIGSAIATAILAPTGAIGLYNKHLDENLQTLSELRATMRKNQITF